MKRYRSSSFRNVQTVWLIAGTAALILAREGFGIESSRVKSLFRNPPIEYSTGPLWVWNDLLTDTQIRDTLRDLASQNVKQVWVHPRPGLMTPYLSKEWFHLWNITLQEAQRLDLKVWIYDENSYPSGFAGGLVPEAMPESRGRGLQFQEGRTPPNPSPDVIGVYRWNDDKWENVTAAFRSGGTLPDARYLIAREARAPNSPWHADRCYVNLLSPGVTEKFLELTLEPYRHAFGNQFGRRIPGVFTDEPNIHPVEELPWSETLAREFRERWGYDLLEVLPSLTRPTGDWRKIRHNYFQVLNEQFIKHWAQPYHDYCEKNRLEWTGHYWDHEWPRCVGVPDNMAMYAWHQRPAIDCLMNQYAENSHAQFGNVRMVKELSSVANQLGKQRTLCEVYGAGGWDLRFEDMKRIGDWLQVLGVNTLNQHLSYITIRGARKRDHPQSFSYHEPWWSAYHVSAEYFARLSAALSQGQQINPVLVLEPTTTAWMYQGEEAKLKELGDSFFALLMGLEAAQVEYDIGCEDIIARHGSINAGELQIGKRSYRRILLPPSVESLNTETKQLLDKIPATIVGELPCLVDGTGGEPVSTNAPDSKRASFAARLAQFVAGLQREEDGFRIERKPDDKGTLFHHRRQLADGQLLFLVNTSSEHRSGGTIKSNLKGVESWNPYTGETLAYPCASSNGGVTTEFELPPSGSLLLFLGRRATNARPLDNHVQTLFPTTQATVSPVEPNVLTLDYVDVTAAGETRTNIYFYQASQFAWKKNGLERNPWDSAVQFGDELISRKFPATSGFEANYRFTIADEVPGDLEVVLERPDLYSITCNGQKLKAEPGGWWLDKAFGRLPIAAAACRGENIITIRACPFSMFHELEPAYLRGNFSLKATDRGFQIERPRPLNLKAAPVIGNSTGTNSPTEGWAAQGYPFYGSGVRYREYFDIARRSGKYSVFLPRWRGSVAQVAVNGQKAGYIDAPPWECDITRWCKLGRNEIEVTVIGTLKNTLGPHHGSPSLGAAWPASFHRAPEFGPPPGVQYDTVAYGLFEPFVLKQIGNE